LGSDEIEKDLRSIISWVWWDEIISSECLDLIGSRWVISDVIEPFVKSASNFFLGSVLSCLHPGVVEVNAFLMFGEFSFFTVGMVEKNTVFDFFDVCSGGDVTGNTDLGTWSEGSGDEFGLEEYEKSD